MTIYLGLIICYITTKNPYKISFYSVFVHLTNYTN